MRLLCSPLNPPIYNRFWCKWILQHKWPSIKCIHLMYEGEKRHLVVVPVLGEVTAPGELDAAHLNRDLHRVGVQVVPVLHPSVEGVPRGAVGDSVLKDLAGKVLDAWMALVHHPMGLAHTHKNKIKDAHVADVELYYCNNISTVNSTDIL